MRTVIMAKAMVTKVMIMKVLDEKPVHLGHLDMDDCCDVGHDEKIIEDRQRAL